MSNVGEFKHLVSVGIGVLRLERLSQLPDQFRSEALKLAHKFEQDVYDLLDGKVSDEQKTKEQEAVKEAINTTFTMPENKEFATIGLEVSGEEGQVASVDSGAEAVTQVKNETTCKRKRNVKAE